MLETFAAFLTATPRRIKWAAAGAVAGSILGALLQAASFYGALLAYFHFHPLAR